ncbi:unnamed protein product [Rotaria sp. Silwood1]|nr:unnamed protein product [Rotaria sp. Silwood1]
MCLERRVLRIGDHIIDVETSSSSSQDADNVINASNWYETEMMAGKSNIMQFISDPEHRIFQLKWNSQAFLEQFRRWSSKDHSHLGIERDHRGTTRDQQRHLLRMTVMLNTIGIVKRGQYSINGKEIQLKSNSLNTIVYNHRSTLQHGMTIPSSQGIDYPYKSTFVRVINEDCLVVYEQMVSQGYRPLLLNMANATSSGGGYRRGDGAQEENIFRRSDYYRSLDIELDQGQPTARFYCTSSSDLVRLTHDQQMYPMDEFGAIYTSGLTVFRQPEDKGYELMGKPMFDVCAIAIAAYRIPKLNEKNLLCSRYSIGMRKKIETIFAVARHHNHNCLILSAFGCGSFRNPPKHVATIFKSVIEQYAGFFKDICFAIIDDHNTGQDFNPRGNYQPFHEILDGLEVKPIKHTTDDMMIGPWRVLNGMGSREITLSDIKIFYLPLCCYGAQCRDIENKQHCREYLHPPICPFADSSKHGNDDGHMLWFRHRIKHSNDTADGSKGQSCEYSKRYRDASEQGDNDDMNRKRLINNLPLCPWTPFYCRQYTLLAEATDIQVVPDDARRHCQEFQHICRFGRQCHHESSLHWDTTIHIAREMCLEGKICSKTYQETHLNSFSHPDIADIRRLCIYTGCECSHRRKLEHVVRYRHSGNYDSSSVIPYHGLNNQINFIQNQQETIATIHNYAESLKLKTPLSIPHQIIKCIRGLSPIYQCSKAVFELILGHGHVMSGERIEKLTSPQGLIQSIQQNKHIQSIINQHKYQPIEDHINDYIKAIVSAAYNRRGRQPQSKITEYASAYSPATLLDKSFDDTIQKEEKFLKGSLSHEEVDTIRRWTVKITEAAFNLSTNAVSSDQVSEKHIMTVFGPHLRQKDGDIVLVFKREVMFHPDAKFSIQFNAQLEQFHQSQLHCSIYGYEYAAAVALITIIGGTRKTMDIDLQTILRYMNSAHSDSFFEGHLPDLIPLDYIEEMYITQTLFHSLTLPAQVAAKDLRDSLRIVSHEGNRYHDHINEKLVKKLNEYIELSHQQLHGSTVTLPASHLKEHVTLPYTLAQVYDQHRRNHKRDPISNDIYIYWQSMYGDMMMVLSNELIDSARNTQYIQSLICYIAETPSTTTNEYHESYSYLHSGHLSQHATIMDQRSFSAYSNKFHRGCNVEDYLTYCLKLEKTTGQVTLSHAGPNSIYNNETISYRFTKSTLDLNDLKYIRISAGSQQVPIRNLMVCFHPLPDLHPLVDKNFHRTSTASREPKAPSHSTAASKDNKSQNIISTVVHAVGSFIGYGIDQKKLTPCRDSINCLLQASENHCKKYSHPCRFSELCQNKDKEPYLTHETHRVDVCALDKSCRRLDDPCHRAMFRHTGRPDFLIPCRDQAACPNRSFEHRMKYSHGEKVHQITATAVEKLRSPSSASMLSSESDSKDQQKTSYHRSHKEKIPCRHGSKCYDQMNPRHCSQYSHPSQQRPRSSADHDPSRTSQRFGSAGYQANDSIPYSLYPYSDAQRHQPGGIDDHQKVPCPKGIACRDLDRAHYLKYSHSCK